MLEVGPDTILMRSTKACKYEIMDGALLAIDPSAGSNSSMPAYAVYHKGELIESGALLLDIKLPLAQRLFILSNDIRDIYAKYSPLVLAYEDIPAQAYGRNATGHATLLKAVGAVLAATGGGTDPNHTVPVAPRVWKRLARPWYTKSDENDAIEIGWVVTELAKQLIEQEQSKQSKKKARKTREK